jgi:hypothetical protein
MAAISIPFLIFMVLTKNYILLTFFIVSGMFGVTGELLISWWWRQFFWKGFWDYKHAAILRGDTSSLNFPAWSLGGILIVFTYFIFENVFNTNMLDVMNTTKIINFLSDLILYELIGIVFSIVLGKIILKKDMRGKTLLRYSVFSSGILLFISLLTNTYGLKWLILFIIWGLICFVTEYLFGKIVVKFVGKKLWLYTYLTIDNGHTSLLNILPFALAGYYLFSVYLLVVYLARII